MENRERLQRLGAELLQRAGRRRAAPRSDGMLDAVSTAGRSHRAGRRRTHRVCARSSSSSRASRASPATTHSSSIVCRLARRTGCLVPPDNSCSRASCDRQCSSELLSKAMDRDETSTLAVRALGRASGTHDRSRRRAHRWDRVVNDLGSFSWLFPAALAVETSEDGRRGTRRGAAPCSTGRSSPRWTTPNACASSWPFHRARRASSACARPPAATTRRGRSPSSKCGRASAETR